MTHETDDQILQKSSTDNEENLDWAKQTYERLKRQQEEKKIQKPVSYTHLTLPTKRIV